MGDGALIAAVNGWVAFRLIAFRLIAFRLIPFCPMFFFDRQTNNNDLLCRFLLL